tara:strand:+ start:38 stop:421 length:384 start_codon:yes stop_codon:yes gene_type:complete
MVFLSLVFSHQASAGFLGKYKDWRDSSLERKHGYVAGYIDHLSGHINGLAWYNARAKGINSCFLQMKIDTDMIIGAIDNAFNRNTKYWDRPVTHVIDGVLHHTCLKFINIERKNDGLQLWKAWDGWK